MGKLINLQDMELIYSVSKEVYEGKYSSSYGVEYLKDKVPSTEASIKMYFTIYSCMRKGTCYKMGTSEAFTKYLLNQIFGDLGEEAYIKALSAVKGNYAYRESVNNTQPGLLRACNDSIQDCQLSINLDDIPTAVFTRKIKEENNPSKTKKVAKIKGVHVKSPIVKPVDIVDGSREENSSLNHPELLSQDVMELNIQPSASILNVFSRLSYKPWYAIAEFVDNSTQSYISHAEELNNAPDFEKLIVDVNYDSENNTLTIVDNAFGMEIDRFKDAILLDSRNDSQSGRNEFGMGLKTAASWFGKVWTVTSTQFGSANKYTATVDIPKLDELHLQNTIIYRENVDADVHGTTIVIEQVTKKITGSRTIGKIRDLLSSMYRRDINNRNIEIWFNKEPIVFEEYPILTNFRDKSWKKELDFHVDFDARDYHVTGFVAIMNPGSFPKAGFALFRQDRVVIGGTDSNYKPQQIFGQAQSQKSLKLFGELNMNDFPVNQAKDGFIWDDGLEDAFIDTLKDNIQEYIEIAEMSIKERATESQFSEQASEELQEDLSLVIDNAFKNGLLENSKDNTKETLEEQTDTSLIQRSDIDEYIDTVLNAEQLDGTLGTVRQYTIPLTPTKTIRFFVQWARCNKKYWIDYFESEADAYSVSINIDHPFFMPFTKEDGFQKVLEKFALAFILAELQAKFGSTKEGYIQTNVIKNYMNRFLEKMAEDQ